MCSSYQCSDEVLSVGNYVGRNSYYDVRDTLAFFPGTVDSIFRTSSYGPTRDLRTKPDICATSSKLWRRDFIYRIFHQTRPSGNLARTHCSKSLKSNDF
jgi:hypothetical protein